MRSKSIIALSILGLMLAACSQTLNNSANSGLNTVEDNASTTWDKTRDFLELKRDKTPPPPPKTQARYCYKFFEDIVCYGKPIPGREDHLVAWQGNAGQTGYVLEPAKSKEQRDLPPLKTVDVPVPPKVKESPALKEIIFDPAELQPKELVPQKAE